MSKHIHCERNLLVALLAVGLSAACMSNPVAGTSESDASPGPALPEADAKVGSPDTGSVTSDVGIAACGNGVLEPGETCDDGNANGLDGCSATCTIEPGGVCPTPGQPCKPTSFCGDGKLDPGEQCDLGINDGSYGGCTPSCTVGPRCGDGLLQVEHETCDLGINDGSYGGCTPSCTVGPYCGDGIVQGQEKCDDGINDGRYRGCNPDCTVSPVCGDGILQADSEQCDDGNSLSGDGCSSTCQCESSTCGHSGSVCGDGKLDIVSGETCDDGNTLNDDGCSDTCQVEPCWNACGCSSTQPCLPIIICGNGKVEGNEACDDGNATPGDGCSGTCQIERGWTCAAPGKPCASVCGDGVLTSNEECDDGNSDNGDGCTNTCKRESASCPPGGQTMRFANPAQSLAGFVQMGPSAYQNDSRSKDPSTIYLDAGKDAVILPGPVVAYGTTSVDVSAIQLTTCLNEESTCNGQDGYRVKVNQRLSYVVTINDWEGEIALGTVELCLSNSTVTAQFVFVGLGGPNLAGGIAHDVTITPVLDGASGAPTIPVDIESRVAGR